MLNRIISGISYNIFYCFKKVKKNEGQKFLFAYPESHCISIVENFEFLNIEIIINMVDMCFFSQSFAIFEMNHSNTNFLIKNRLIS